MSTELAPPIIEGALPAATPTEDVSFVDSFQAFLETGSNPAPAAPAPEPTPEPKAKATKPAKVDPIKELDDAAPGDDPNSFNLPIDEDSQDEPTEDPDADKENPYDKGTPQHRRFAEMRKESSSLKSELDGERQTRTQLEARVKEIEATAARALELEEKIKEYEAKITVTNLTESEAYREQITKPLKEIWSKAASIAAKYEIDADDLEKAFSIEDSDARSDALEELMSARDVRAAHSHTLFKLGDDIQPLVERREELLTNADKALAELEVNRTRAEQERTLQSVEERKATVDKVAKHITTKLPFLKTLEGVDFEQLVGNVRDADFNALDTPNKAYSQIAAQLLPKLVKSYDAAIRQVEQLSDDLAKYKKQTPRMTPDFGGAPDSNDEEETFMDRAKRQFGG